MPVPRDDKERPPCIPEAVMERKLRGVAKKRKLEREIELEEGDDYVLGNFILHKFYTKIMNGF